MGMISKRIHQKTTNRLAEPVRAVTSLDVDQVLPILREQVESTPAKTGLLQSGQKLWLFGTPPGPWDVFYGPPSKKEPGKVVRVWRAAVKLKTASTGTETMISLELVQWKTVDGKLVARSEFESFRDGFFGRVARHDPAFNMLGA